MNPGRLDKPLTEKEVEELEQFLASKATPEETMDMSMFDGFLTAIMIGPNLIQPSRWMPLVWGSPKGAGYASLEQAQRIMSLIFRHMNSIGKQFRETPDDFEPLFYVRTVDGKECTITEEWCTGFMLGVTELDPDPWLELFKDAKGREWLIHVSMFTTGKGLKAMGDAAGKSPDPHLFHERLVDQINPAVCNINTFWLERRGRAWTAPVPRREKVWAEMAFAPAEASGNTKNAAA